MTATGGPPRLDLYDIAFLTGGPRRVVDTALVALVESGRVRVHAPGQLAVVQPGRRHPVEAALMDAIGTHGHRSVDTIHWRLVGDERLLDSGRSLTAAGLLRRRVPLAGRGRGQRLSMTRAGRRALREVRQAPSSHALCAGTALVVALDGRAVMPDPALRAAIFEPPVPPLPRSSGVGWRLRRAELRDPELAIHRTQQTALGGAAAMGFLEGGAGDGGGF
ncbi:TIGR04222 domain-containing membrane protein [Blastococcus brunescens]|uniref:TIGR04222 domain-containing membrane protein n=1 Tax=Blastococcus brunescens TaxID=1564165 RepID=A0ABZ1AZH1_9ACTN|nr:TIGR04222 domain-containing membrane protein [Blastococcus sp. BMG 8361]WRL63048.1 TIGR04222 domain-containing membrane protein [Blastococcus sp. BMG 8361]